MSFVVVFPGQGSQSIGMLADLATVHAEVTETFAEASDALGYDLWERIQNGPEADLNRTDCTQPAMLTAGIAVWRVWLAQGGSQPAAMAGHSLGEYSALVAAGALPFAAAVATVAKRGEYMQAAVPEGEGAMAAVLGLDDAGVEQACAETAAAMERVVEPVNYNAPGQVVIAGHVDAVIAAMDACKAAGAKLAKQIPVSVPAHSSLMAPAAGRLADRLAEIEIQAPNLPVIHNVDAEPRRDADAIRAALVAQLDSPVRWTSCVHKLAASEPTMMLECGPGRVLSGLGKRIVKGPQYQAVYDLATLEQALTSLAS